MEKAARDAAAGVHLRAGSFDDLGHGRAHPSGEAEQHGAHRARRRANKVRASSCSSWIHVAFFHRYVDFVFFLRGWIEYCGAPVNETKTK